MSNAVEFTVEKCFFFTHDDSIADGLSEDRWLQRGLGSRWYRETSATKWQVHPTLLLGYARRPFCSIFGSLNELPNLPRWDWNLLQLTIWRSSNLFSLKYVLSYVRTQFSNDSTWTPSASSHMPFEMKPKENFPIVFHVFEVPLSLKCSPHLAIDIKGLVLLLPVIGHPRRLGRHRTSNTGVTRV